MNKKYLCHYGYFEYGMKSAKVVLGLVALMLATPVVGATDYASMSGEAMNTCHEKLDVQFEGSSLFEDAGGSIQSDSLPGAEPVMSLESSLDALNPEPRCGGTGSGWGDGVSTNEAPDDGNCIYYGTCI